MRTVMRDVDRSLRQPGSGGDPGIAPSVRLASVRLASARTAGLFAAAFALFAAILMPQAARAADDCANADVRAAQGATHLPDCRAYEAVSPLDKSFAYQASGYGGLLSAGGDRIPMLSVYLEDSPPDELLAPSMLYIGVRDPVTGWSRQPMSPPLSHPFGGTVGQDWNADVGRLAYFGQTQSQWGRSEGQYFMRDLNGSWDPVSPPIKPVSGIITESHIYEHAGASADLDRIVFGRNPQAVTRLLAEDPVPSNAFGLKWEVAGVNSGSPVLRAVARESNDPVTNAVGAAIGGQCGALIGSARGPGALHASAKHAVSNDGSMIYFTARPGAVSSCTTAAAPARVFARHDGRTTVQVSQSQCTREAPAPLCTTTPAADDRFEAASADGRRVFFTTVRQLTNSDTDATRDLYVYDFDPPAGRSRLLQVSYGDGTVGSTNGSGANVAGVVRFSDDGSRAYFVSTGRLTSEPNTRGQVAAAGTNNLYVWQRDATHPDGRVAFIVTLPAGDSGLWAALDRSRPAQVAPKLGTDLAGRSVGGDGHVMFFSSSGALTPDAPGGKQDIFRYDDSETPGALELVSRRDPGSPGTGAEAVTMIGGPDGNLSSFASFESRFNAVSEDGTLVAFQTTRALVPEDTNGKQDIYQWRAGPDGGSVALLTDGAQEEEAFLHGVTLDGATVALSTEQQLVPDDVDDSGDVYVLRTGGGFFPAPPPDPVPDPCVGDSCQGESSDQPAFAAPGTLGAQDPGALPARGRMSVAAVKPAAVRRFARSGRLPLKVRVTGAGKLTATATARVRQGRSGKPVSRRVALARATATKPGTVTAVLKLSSAARKELGRRGRLVVSVRVKFSKVSAPKTVRLVLTTTKGKA